jgi:hypothetical protein
MGKVSYIWNPQSEKGGIFMFDKITDLTKTRSIMDSMVFYVGMSVILLGLTTLIGNVLGTVGVGGDVVSGIFGGVGLSTIIGTLFVLISGGSIVHHKKLGGDMLSVIMVLAGVYLSFTSSVFLGLLLVSYLTTVKGK